MLDPVELRKTLGCFLTGVTVITTQSATGERRGFTANSFTSVSLTPPLVLVCLSEKASSFEAFSEADSFAVNVLSENQKDISALFASKQRDKFASLTTSSVAKSPILEGTSAWLACSTYQKVHCGDHIILIGKIEALGRSDAAPLGFYSGNYFTFRQEREAIDVSHEASGIVGGIFEKDGSILLIRRNGTFSLPTGQTLGEKNFEPKSLFEILKKAGIDVSVDFVFSIAHEDGDHRAGVYYRGRIASFAAPAESGFVLVPIMSIPWDAIKSLNQRTMLTRYLRERTESRFGIYVGTAAGGAIKSLAVGDA